MARSKVLEAQQRMGWSAQLDIFHVRATLSAILIRVRVAFCLAGLPLLARTVTTDITSAPPAPAPPPPAPAPPAPVPAPPAPAPAPAKAPALKPKASEASQTCTTRARKAANAKQVVFSEDMDDASESEDDSDTKSKGQSKGAANKRKVSSLMAIALTHSVQVRSVQSAHYISKPLSARHGRPRRLLSAFATGPVVSLWYRSEYLHIMLTVLCVCVCLAVSAGP